MKKILIKILTSRIGSIIITELLQEFKEHLYKRLIKAGFDGVLVRLVFNELTNEEIITFITEKLNRKNETKI